MTSAATRPTKPIPAAVAMGAAPAVLTCATPPVVVLAPAAPSRLAVEEAPAAATLLPPAALLPPDELPAEPEPEPEPPAGRLLPSGRVDMVNVGCGVPAGEATTRPPTAADAALPTDVAVSDAPAAPTGMAEPPTALME